MAEPINDAAPTKPAPAKTGERRALVFPILVTRDPDRVLRGRMDGELTADGLYLRRVRQPPAFAAVGGRARYLGTNRLVVTVEGREVELAVIKPWASTYHLARDTAAFLNRQGDMPEGRAYNLSWYLYALPVLFVALPSAAIPLGLLTDGCLGAFVWCVITVVLAGITLAVVMQPWLRPRGRLIGAGAMLGLGAAVFLIAIPCSPSYTVDPALWKSYGPPGVGFTVLMPGTPITGKPNVNLTPQKFTVDVTDPEVQFAVFVADAPGNDPNAFQPFAMNLNYQAINDARSRLQQEYGANGFNSVYAESERDLTQYSRTCHEVTFMVIPGYGYNSNKTKTLVARIFIVNGKVYTLAALGPRVKADGSDMLKFFNSVQFTATSKPAVMGLPSPTVIPNLLAYWSFDGLQQGFGPIENINDDSGQLLSGTLHQATLVPDGKRGKAVRFNGRGSYFDYSNVFNLNIGIRGEFTVAGWVRTVSPTGVIVSQRNSLDPNSVVDLKLIGGQLTAVVWPDRKPVQDAQFAGGDPINDGQWHHFALTRRQDGATQLFIDGVFKASHLAPNTAGAITTNLRTWEASASGTCSPLMVEARTPPSSATSTSFASSAGR